ncbi:MAG: type VI secretion system tube protein Hcp [Labilithrix sp.]|nr:type VI secretion system tube protein Hcp [Labilithrix sp.]
MAGRLIVFKNEVQTVKGDVEAEGYKEFLRLESLSFAATAYTQADSATGTVHQSSMMITIPFGPWVAELQQRLYHGTMLGDVEITELEQKVDAANKKSWKKVREVHLMDGWIESMSHAWSGITASIQMSIQYTDMTFATADKIAHFSRTDAAQK